MAKYCEKCRKEHPDYMWFCPRCGVKLVMNRGAALESCDTASSESYGAIERQAAVPGTEDLMENW